MTNDTFGIDLFDPYRVGVVFPIVPWALPTAIESVRFADEEAVSTFLTNSIQSPNDPRVREVFRNTTKAWTPRHTNTGLISILLPEDFGSADHYQRRYDAIQNDLDRMRDSGNLLSLFEALLDESTSFRD